MAYSGYFKPTNPRKYKGNVDNIVWRSQWELRVMRFFDSHPNIVKWSSEEIVIPYVDPVSGRSRRYFPDFYVKLKDKTGKIVEYVIEVKPSGQTEHPKKPAKITRQYIKEVCTYAVNQAKWEAASKYCMQNNLVFKVMTEKELGIAI